MLEIYYICKFRAPTIGSNMSRPSGDLVDQSSMASGQIWSCLLRVYSHFWLRYYCHATGIHHGKFRYEKLSMLHGWAESHAETNRQSSTYKANPMQLSTSRSPMCTRKGANLQHPFIVNFIHTPSAQVSLNPRSYNCPYSNSYSASVVSSACRLYSQTSALNQQQ